MQGLDNYKLATPDWMNRLDEVEVIDYPTDLEEAKKEAYEYFLYCNGESNYYLINGTTEQFITAREVELEAWDDFLTIDKEYREQLERYNNQ